MKELERQVNALKQMCKRNGAASNETSGTIFGYENLKGHHEAVLNDILRAYAPTNRVKHKTVLVLTEFVRTVFKQQKLLEDLRAGSIRHMELSASDFKHLTQTRFDRPAGIPPITLIDFALDALDLGHYDLQGYRLDALRNSRDSFWLWLGESDDERDKKFNSLLEKKPYWSCQIGICISEALEDIRYYRLR